LGADVTESLGRFTQILLEERYDGPVLLPPFDDFAHWNAETFLVTVSGLRRGRAADVDAVGCTARELARAESSLKTGEAYVQDRAPGDIGAIEE
jgi:hypothetical protein